MFEEGHRQLGDRLINALVPYCDYWDPGKHSLSMYSFRELDELFGFCARHASLVKMLDSGEVGLEDSREMSVRFRLAVYCHVMEADFPLLVILNLCRLLDGLKSSWAFISRDKESDIPKLDKKGSLIVLDKVKCKIDHLRRYEYSGSFPDLFEYLWNGVLRNAYAHSQYVINTGGDVAFTQYLTGASAKSASQLYNTLTHMKFSEINSRYFAALEFLASFRVSFGEYMHIFSDRGIVESDLGQLRWNKDASLWEPAGIKEDVHES